MLSILRLTLRDKREFEFRTDSRVAEAIAMHHQDGGVFYSIEDHRGLSIDLKNVIAVQVDQLRPAVPVDRPPVKPLESKPVPLTYNPAKPPPLGSGQEVPKELYKVECKCGTEYFCRLFNDTTKCRCKECNDTVFVDKFAPQRTGDNGQPATLVTNRYRVPFVEGA
jgi:hypothetical protein